MPRPELTIKQILAWSDAYHDRTGRWPNSESGFVWEVASEKWRNIDTALRLGLRGLHRGQSIAKLLDKHRGKRNRKQLPHFTLRQILTWADAHRQRTRQWPTSRSGPIAASRGETWWAVDMALRHGQRGLPGGSSLARLLAAKRRVPNRGGRPRLTVRQILGWADDCYRRTGNWPTETNGPIGQANGETWSGVVQALRRGRRGLPRTSLFRLLVQHRRVGRHVRRPRLTIEQVLSWADEHKAQTGEWPREIAGPVVAAAGETWLRVNDALSDGKRGFPGGTSLAKLLGEKRGVRSRATLRPLSEELILRWARAFKRRHGRWPNRHSGPIAGANGETWGAVAMALKRPGRGMRRRTTLARLIASRH